MARIFSKDENRAWQQTLPTKKSSAAVAIVCGNDALMVKASYKNEWTFPGGVVDENESPQTAALRELHEEVGVTLTSSDVSFLGVIYTPAGDGFKDRYSFVFRHDAASMNIPLLLQESEIEAAEWVPIGEIGTRANGRGSYLLFQELIERGELGAYLEVGGS